MALDSVSVYLLHALLFGDAVHVSGGSLSSCEASQLRAAEHLDAVLQTDRQTDRPTDQQTDRQTDR
jgi:hypothetical protein